MKKSRIFGIFIVQEIKGYIKNLSIYTKPIDKVDFRLYNSIIQRRNRVIV